MSNNIPVNGWPQLKDLEAVQPTLDRLDKIEAWKRTVKEETFTGDDIIIENALALPARSLITEINAIQDLHGYDHPWVGGAGDNMLDLTALNTSSGVTKTVANDRLTITADGTSGSYQSVFFGNTTTLPFAAGTYYIKLKCVSNSNPDLLAAAGFRNSQNTFTGQSISLKTTGEKSVTVTLNEACYFSIMINGNESDRANTVVLDDIIISKTDVPYSPYSNICPISGRTAVVITRSDGDEISEDFTIQLGQTVYSGVIDWVTGALTIDKKTISLSGDTIGSIIWEAFTLTISDGEDLTNTPLICSHAGQIPNIDMYNSVNTDNYNNAISSAATGGSGLMVRLRNRYLSAQTDTAYKAWFAAQATAGTPVSICYELATPIELTLTPTEVQMLKGYNRVTLTDGYGTIEIKALTGANWS